MKQDKNFSGLRNLTAICLMLTMFAASSMVAFAAPDRTSPMGELIVSGSSFNGTEAAVTVNGEQALSGRTLFSSSTIATTESTSATVKLGSLGSVSLAPNSVLSLSFGENSITGTLSAGRVDVSNSEGVDVKITTANGLFSNKNMESGVVSAEANAFPPQDDDDSKVSNGSQLALILVFIGVVGATTFYVLSKDETAVGSTVSPVR